MLIKVDACIALTRPFGCSIMLNLPQNLFVQSQPKQKITLKLIFPVDLRFKVLNLLVTVVGKAKLRMPSKLCSDKTSTPGIILPHCPILYVVHYARNPIRSTFLRTLNKNQFAIPWSLVEYSQIIDKIEGFAMPSCQS